ncbi:MAG: type II secretion system ATPase GspE [Gammaproteobacteria bacterium]
MSLIYDSLKQAQQKRKSSDVSMEQSIPTGSNQSNVLETLNSVDASIPLFDDSMDKQAIQAQLIESLKNKNVVSDSDISNVQRMCDEKPESSFLSLLARMGIASDADIAEVLSDVLDIPFVSKAEFPSDNMTGELISQRFLKEHKVIPLAIDEQQITVAMSDPTDVETQQAISMACDRAINVNVGIASEITSSIDQLFGDRASQMDQILDDVALEEISDEEVDHLKDLASEAPVIRLVNLLIQRAIEEHASDIHIEPFEGQLKVRYRIDGVLKEAESPARQFAAAIISRIKIMAKLDIAERRLPQDGRIRTRMQGIEFDMRISTIPTMHGESVVIRLLNQESVALDFNSLGFSQQVCDKLTDILGQPHGMVLITGPTGSGKTTSLYAALNQLNEPNRKIITVEDPIEYQLEGINQIQAKSSIGLTFASALRSIVRQDPDVIMVGEMRDLETAEICIKSALTGHLVLSTLHTNDAASSITRLIEMRVEDYLLTSTLNAVIAQRLVRVLCQHCKQPLLAPQKFIKDCENNHLEASSDTQIYSAKGCDECNGTGYAGRTCIVELLCLDDEIKKKILEHADANELQNMAIKNGMQTLYLDGLAKVLSGITTLEEITRVTKE